MVTGLGLELKYIWVWMDITRRNKFSYLLGFFGSFVFLTLTLSLTATLTLIQRYRAMNTLPIVSVTIILLGLRSLEAFHLSGVAVRTRLGAGSGYNVFKARAMGSVQGERIGAKCGCKALDVDG